jgi:hypothetical protein
MDNASNRVADEEDAPVEGVPAQIVMPEAQLGGVYANFAFVSHSEHEFTLDFVRMAYGSQPVQGVVVSRVSVSPAHRPSHVTRQRSKRGSRPETMA